jgi:hypothetical protein
MHVAYCTLDIIERPMPSLETTSFIVGTIGTLASIVGIAFALYERMQRQKLEAKIKSQQWATLDRARYVIGDHVLLKEFELQLDHPLSQRLWNVHQAASDLYIILVEQYLYTVESFTYEDLRRLAANNFFYFQWQEQQWRLLICQRPENRNVDPPPYFVTEARNSAFRPSSGVQTNSEGYE